ncbi:MAG TPA: cob(I)yrinic acid a,c-diamide adenosyltransferase [Gemmatimonadaceae bacterium]|nr:cob(I)yrinic acid a,c-diamide adenosyltransferase [Gemmatimonadaceae bacterium]
MALRIYTRTGDRGDTGLFGGGRVGKDHARVDAYGEVDELNAVIGLARAVAPLPAGGGAGGPLAVIDALLAHVQRDLFAIGALLATPDLAKMRAQLEKARLDEGRIAELERAIDAADEKLEPLKAFILPGGSPKAAALHVARTVCRRAERRVVHLQREVELPEIVVVYLNRLSDLLFTLARLTNRAAGVPDVEW